MVADLNRVEVQLAELKGAVATVEAKAGAIKDLTSEQIGSLKGLLSEKPSLIAILGPVIGVMVALSAGLGLAISRHDQTFASYGDKLDGLSDSDLLTAAALENLETAQLNHDLAITKVLAVLDQVRSNTAQTADDVSMMKGDFSLIAQSLVFRKRIQPILESSNVVGFLGLDGDYLFVDKDTNEIVKGERNDLLQANLKLVLEGLPINVGASPSSLIPQPRP